MLLNDDLDMALEVEAERPPSRVDCRRAAPPGPPIIRGSLNCAPALGVPERAAVTASAERLQKGPRRYELVPGNRVLRIVGLTWSGDYS